MTDNTRLLIFAVSYVVIAAVAASIILSDAPVLLRVLAAASAVVFIGGVAVAIITVSRSKTQPPSKRSDSD